MLQVPPAQYDLPCLSAVSSKGTPSDLRASLKPVTGVRANSAGRWKKDQVSNLGQSAHGL
jgi:hypothetical protein